MFSKKVNDGENDIEWYRMVPLSYAKKGTKTVPQNIGVLTKY